jgi:hypothetical protein
MVRHAQPPCNRSLHPQPPSNPQAHLPSPAPMSMMRLLASSEQLWCRQSKIFCMPVAVMEP